MKYILKYSPEMTIKSRPVRTRFARQLGRNLDTLFARVPLEARVRVNWDYIEVESAEGPQVERLLANTPGVCAFERVLKFPFEGLESVLGHAVALYGERLRGKSFAVRCKRAGRHDFGSMDVERFVGAGLMARTDAARVDLGAPQVLVQLEIRDQELFIVEERFRGLGGFPLGTQDGVLSLISGGFDSAVSSYLAIRRGLRTHYCFFNLGGREHEIAVKEVAAYLWMKFGAALPVKFVTVPFEGVVAEILEKVDNAQMGVVLKRMMLRAASRVAAEMNLDALVTGESVAQVSSQTLANLAVIDKVSATLVLRPLIMTDKQDIVDIARRIGTEVFSAAIPEYCGVISVKPTTRARLHRIEREESRFDFAILEQAVAARRIEAIDRLQSEAAGEQASVEPVNVIPPGAVVLDIRHPDEEERRPLDLGAEVRKIPFYKLGSVFQTLDPGVPYLLYCDKGIMSRLHASYLRDEGHENVGVYRPE